jgi:hypothetical protein
MAALTRVLMLAPHRGFDRGAVAWVSPATAAALVAAHQATALGGLISEPESATIEPSETAVMPRPRPHRRRPVTSGE